MTRRRTGLALLALLTLGAAHAQYPVKPIRMIVTYPPGGGADTMARLIAPKLTESLGQTIVVENRPGASGTIAADAVANSAPDGYTLMLDASSYAVNPSLYAKLAYDPAKAFTPVTLIAVFPNMLVVHPAFGVASVKEPGLAKKKPGYVSYVLATAPRNTSPGELFRLQAGLTWCTCPARAAARR
jgi:tripartite-type tricarboxylate transporter receptor subunit TctC